MAILANGLETIERGSTTWRLICNSNFAKLATTDSLDDYYTKTESDDKFCTKIYCTKLSNANTSVTLSSDWDNYGSPYRDLLVYTVKDDAVSISGTVKQTGSGSTIATLSTEYRPSAKISFAVPTEDSTLGIQFGEVSIDTDGNIVLESGGTDRVTIEIMYIK